MSKEYRMVEVCDNCGELVEHCICEDEYCGEYGEYKYCDCECCECEEIDDSEEEEIRIIGETTQKIFEVYPCPHCVAEVVADLAMRFKNLGKTNHQDYIREMNED